jgi:NADH-quinone oxidoreductase subunit C
MTATSDLIAALQGQFPALTPRPSADHPAVNVSAASAPELLKTLRDAHGYDMLMDLTALDQGEGASPRFLVVWHLFSTTTHGYVRVAAACEDDAAPSMPSVVPQWAGANWHEREAFDMFGIQFAGHPDLRRILMWDGYPYHPLRKDFPLAGKPTELPDAEIAAEVGFKVQAAPMAGGPFVATPSNLDTGDAEPRAKDESWNERRVKPE